MITKNEKQNIKEIQEVFMANFVKIGDIEITPELQAQFVGANMARATIDALFAIREGASWRDIADPKEIARAVLRQGKIGE